MSKLCGRWDCRGVYLFISCFFTRSLQFSFVDTGTPPRRIKFTENVFAIASWIRRLMLWRLYPLRLLLLGVAAATATENFPVFWINCKTICCLYFVAPFESSNCGQAPTVVIQRQWVDFHLHGAKKNEDKKFQNDFPFSVLDWVSSLWTRAFFLWSSHATSGSSSSNNKTLRWISILK